VPMNRIVAGWSDDNPHTLRSKYKRKTDSKAAKNYFRWRNSKSPKDLSWPTAPHEHRPQAEFSLRISNLANRIVVGRIACRAKNWLKLGACQDMMSRSPFEVGRVSHFEKLVSRKVESDDVS